MAVREASGGGFPQNHRPRLECSTGRGIEAPDHVRILREELAFWQEEAVGGDGELDPELEGKKDWSEAAGTDVSLVSKPD